MGAVPQAGATGVKEKEFLSRTAWNKTECEQVADTLSEKDEIERENGLKETAYKIQAGVA